MDNSMTIATLNDFTAVLASKAPVPGGGGAAALSGALASALASMVCALTTGKKKYAAYEDDLKRIADRAEALRTVLLADIDADAAAFEPLSKAYAIPKDAPERAEVMESALRAACEAPMGIAKRCGDVIELLSELADKGCAIAVSDVGVGAQLARAALLSAGLNVRINIKSMNDRPHAALCAAELASLETKYLPLADETYQKVLRRIG